MPKLSSTRFTESSLRKLRVAAGKAEKVHFDAATPGLGIRFRNGRGTFFSWFRADGRVKRLSLGEWPTSLSLPAARAAVARNTGRVALGVDPVMERRRERQAARVERQHAQNAQAATVEKRVKAFIAKKEADRPKAAKEYNTVFRLHVLPRWRGRVVADLTRRDVLQLLDELADKHGPALADRVLAYLKPFLAWHSTRFDHPLPNLSKLRRLRPADQVRQRALTDDEIRLAWKVADTFKPEAFGCLIKLLIVTGQRRTEVAGMEWSEIDADNVWTVPATRFKGRRAHTVPLSETARKIIASAPKLNDEFVLSTGSKHLRGFSKFKRAFDEKMLEAAKAEAAIGGLDPENAKVEPWQLHDLRRTARGLLSRAGIRSEIAEIYIGHALPKLQQIYDKWGYLPERRHAADALAGMVTRIVANKTADVVPFKAAEGA